MANYGASGYPGCSGNAHALSAGTAENGLCPPGGVKVRELVASILGVASDGGGAGEKMVAFVHCRGNNELTKRDFVYEGIEDCNAAHLIHQGDVACKYGCLHLGSCI